MGFLSGLFGKKKRTLKDLSTDDLTREQITLKNEQRKVDQEAERLDKDEAQLKSEYAEAASDTQRRAIARRIQDVRTRRGGLETRANYCHKMLRTINGFLVIKQNMDFFERMGVASALSEMDMSEVETFINDATVEGTLQQDKLAAMLQQVTEGVERISESAGDGSLTELMAELDGEVSTQPVRQTAGQDSELATVMTELDAAAAKGAEAARKLRSAKEKEAARLPQQLAKETLEEG
jgi:hypothetical protein